MADTQTTLPNRGPDGSLLDRLGLARPTPGRREEQSLRSRIVDFVKTFVWVAPLTALIWVYAEREQWIRVNDITTHIQVKSSASDRIVTMSGVQEGTVYLELRGPRGGVEAVRNALLDIRNPPVPVIIPDNFEPGFSGEVSIAEWIGRSELFKRHAVTVENSRPATVNLKIEAKAAAAASVAVTPEQRGKIVGTITFKPDKVSVEGPRPALTQIPPDQLTVHADISKLFNRQPGPYDEVVPLTFARPGFVLRPNTVRAIVDIKPSEPTTLDSIPIRYDVSGAAISSDKYIIRHDPLLVSGVTVTGPPSAIEAMKQAWQDGKFTPTAIVRITQEDLNAADRAGGEYVVRKRLNAVDDYIMPKDVTVTSQDKDVTIIITLR